MKRIISVLTAACILLSATAVNAAFWNALPEFTELYNAKNYDKINEIIMKDDRGTVTSTASVNVVADENTITGNTTERILGTGTEAFAEMLKFVDPVTGESTPEWKKFSKEMYKIPMIRFGGHDANKVNLLTQIGPLNERKKAEIPNNIDIEKFYLQYGKESLTTPGKEIDIMGTCEFIKVFLENNPDVELCLVASVTHAQPEDTANLARFCLDGKDESEWGALRARYIREEPLNLACIELGNELYANPLYTEQINQSKAEWYVETCKKHIEAVRKYYPDIDISACICSNGRSIELDKNGYGFDHWNPYIIKELGQIIDIFSFHLYHSGYELSYNGDWIYRTVDYFEQFFGPDHGKKLAITEGSKWATDEFAAKTMESGLATCQYLNFLNDNIDIIYCYTYYAFSSRWAQVYKTIEGNWAETPVGMVFRIYQDNMGDRIVKSSLDWSDYDALGIDITKAYNKNHFSVGVTAEGDDTLKVIMSNREPYTAVDVNFKFNNNYTLTEETVFRANNQKSMMFSDKNKDAFHIDVNKKNEPGFKTYTVPNESMVVLTLKSDKKIPKFGTDSSVSDEPVYSGEKKFPDMNCHWAENEVNILADREILSGKDGKFYPNEKITRAEFSAMICKAAAIKNDEFKKVFSDVNEKDWYAKSVYAVWANGYIRGLTSDSFKPQEMLTSKDAAEALYRICVSEKADAGDVDTVAYINSAQLQDKIGKYSSWDTDALAYVMKNGLINKFYETGNYNPDDGVTRAEAAVMIYRLCNMLGL